MSAVPVAKGRESAHSTGEKGPDLEPVRYSHRLEHLGYRVACALVRTVRHEHSATLGAIAGRLAWTLLRRRRQTTIENLEKTLVEVPEELRRRLARRSFETLGCFLFEQVSAARFEPKELERRFDVVGAEHLAAATAAGRGVLLLTGHFGPFDLAAYPVRSHVAKLHLVYRPASNPLVDGELRAIRERTGAILLPRQRVAQRMFLALRHGEVVAAAIDQRVNPLAGSTLVDFLGRPAWATSVPALLHQRTGAAVVPLFTYPAGRGRYRLEIDPPVSAESLGDDPEAELTRRYFEPLERRIRRDPELWMWLHERWQIVFRHRDPRYRERLARESGLAELPQLEANESPVVLDLDREARVVLEQPFLESCRNVQLCGPSEVVLRAARDLVAAALQQGWAARAEHAPALADRLRAGESKGRLGAELRELDRRALVWIEGLDDVVNEDARRLLARQLERRSGRGSIVLDTNARGQRGDALDAALERAASNALPLRL
ncbi:MAG TPA: lysophospholipid acyltransferase family protein [Thermoanaerobaculia bacterium]|nr:lysophospholipid acyltransferase family protein [Thermoanaerobaculia bacterium]